ncbi:MAG TPA: hypothetical protein VJH34_04290 [archaeon]|nr:hypothetical protein [archaeon]
MPKEMYDCPLPTEIVKVNDSSIFIHGLAHGVFNGYDISKSVKYLVKNELEKWSTTDTLIFYEQGFDRAFGFKNNINLPTENFKDHRIFTEYERASIILGYIPPMPIFLIFGFITPMFPNSNFSKKERGALRMASIDPSYLSDAYDAVNSALGSVYEFYDNITTRTSILRSLFMARTLKKHSSTKESLHALVGAGHSVHIKYFLEYGAPDYMETELDRRLSKIK